MSWKHEECQQKHSQTESAELKRNSKGPKCSLVTYYLKQPARIEHHNINIQSSVGIRNVECHLNVVHFLTFNYEHLLHLSHNLYRLHWHWCNHKKVWVEFGDCENAKNQLVCALFSQLETHSSTIDFWCWAQSWIVSAELMLSLIAAESTGPISGSEVNSASEVDIPSAHCKIAPVTKN